MLTVINSSDKQENTLLTEILNFYMKRNGLDIRLQEIIYLTSSYELLLGKRYTWNQKAMEEVLMDRPEGSFERFKNNILKSTCVSCFTQTENVGQNVKTEHTCDKVTGLSDTDSLTR